MGAGIGSPDRIVRVSVLKEYLRHPLCKRGALPAELQDYVVPNPVEKKGVHLLPKSPNSGQL